MELKTQIISLVFSFVFGFIFSICTNINYRFLFSKNLTLKIIITSVYVLDFSLLYFILIKHLNNGIIHTYFLLFIGLGYLVSFISLNKYINIFKKKVKLKLKKVSNKEKNN